MPKHIRFIADHLMKVESGEIKRLIITTPPRHGKSSLTTIKFPSWYLGRNQNKRMIIASYGDSLAKNFSRQSRNDLKEFGKDVFDLELAADSKAVNSWSLSGRSGGLVSAGVGTGLTGKGGDCILIDDPIKDRVEANSKLIRDRCWDWYTQVARTRLHPGGAIIVILTRWHQDDLAGRIMDNDPEGWTILNLPAISEDNDLLGREVGEALWPERFPVKDLEAIRSDVGDYAFTSLYQQRPAPPDGSIIKRDWIKYYDEMPNSFDKVIQTWDLSTKATDTSSYVVGQVWGKKGPDRYLLDQYRSRSGFMESMKAIKFMRSKWKESKSIYIEEKANGPAVIQVLKKEIDGIISFNPKSSKEDRLRACEPLFQAGNILLPSTAISNWIMDLVYEITTFPFAQNDDQADCLSMAQEKLDSGFDFSNLKIDSSSGELTPSFSGYNYAKN